MSVSNESSYVITDITLDFDFDNELLRIDRHEPGYAVKREKFVLGNLGADKSKSITIYFDPLMCSKGTEINCQVTYRDYQSKLNSVFMEPMKISVICPIMKTDQDINVGMLKALIRKLPSRDSRVYEIQNGFDIRKLTSLAREAIEKRDVRHIRTLHTSDGKTCEIWYYGKTKVSKDDIVIKVSILTAHHTMELFAATCSAEALTGLLAEVGRELKQIVESKASGKGKVVNVTIKDSVVQRSNLLDMCDMDGICDVNIVIEDSVIQRTNVAAVNLQEKQGIEKELLRRREEEEKAVQETIKLKAVERELKYQEEDETQIPNTVKNFIGIQFVLIPSGIFSMGSNESNDEKPIHKVRIVRPFYLGKYPVTQREWEAIMGNNPSLFKGDDMPVENVSWYDAQDFIKKLNAREDTNKYRLPSEAEWEYACRAGSLTRYSFGDSESSLDEYAWYSSNSGRQTHPVGQKKSNKWGLYDMHGNVWEWVQDEWHSDYNGAPDDGGTWEKYANRKPKKNKGFLSHFVVTGTDWWKSGGVVRGGGWVHGARGCRSANRDLFSGFHKYGFVGFRLLREV